MAKKKQVFFNDNYIDPATGFAYTLYRSMLDYYDDEKGNHLLNNIISEDGISVFTDARKDSAEYYMESIKDYVDEYINDRGFEEAYFSSYTQRVKKLHKKIVKKEETILNILKKTRIATATVDIRKMKAHHNDIKDLVFRMSSKYNALEELKIGDKVKCNRRAFNDTKENLALNGSGKNYFDTIETIVNIEKDMYCFTMDGHIGYSWYSREQLSNKHLGEDNDRT